jgi:hypothetical protein
MKSILINMIIRILLFLIDFALVFAVYKFINFEITVLLVLTYIASQGDIK